MTTSFENLLEAAGLADLSESQRSILENGIQALVVQAILDLDDVARAAVANAGDEELRALVRQTNIARIRLNNEIAAKRSNEHKT